MEKFPPFVEVVLIADLIGFHYKLECYFKYANITFKKIFFILFLYLSAVNKY